MSLNMRVAAASLLCIAILVAASPIVTARIQPCLTYFWHVGSECEWNSVAHQVGLACPPESLKLHDGRWVNVSDTHVQLNSTRFAYGACISINVHRGVWLRVQRSGSWLAQASPPQPPPPPPLPAAALLCTAATLLKRRG
jgi:hypothetical protein